MIHLSFKQTNSERMVRAAATLLFNGLERSGASSVAISDLAEHPQYGFTASAVTEPVGPKLVRITDLQDGKIDWETVPYCECADSAKYLLKENDILFARTGATTGKTHLVTSVEPAVFASYLIRIRPKSGIHPGFLHAFFQSDNYWSQIADEKEGSAQPNVNGEKLAALKIPSATPDIQSSIFRFLEAVRQRQDGKPVELPALPPPIENQRRIVARIEELAAQIQEARALRQNAVDSTRALLFSGAEESFRLRDGWKVMQVGEFCEPSQYGYTESATDQKVGPRFLRITDIQNGKVDWSKVPFCRCPEPTKYLLRANDLVFARTGATTGKSFVIRDCPEAVFASYLIRLRVRHSVSVGYKVRHIGPRLRTKRRAPVNRI